MIGQTTYWPSPAKLNLFLYINGRRPDGYHELQTLFQFLDHGDQITITANMSGDIHLTCSIPELNTPNNLIYRAAQLLQQHTQTHYGAEIDLDKQLPMGGGVGGGSSNAATTLVALNFLWQTGLNEEQLLSLAAQLGADVPVFVKGVAAFAQGIGEQLIEAHPEQKWYLVIHPPVSISTAHIFSHPNLTRNSPKLERKERLASPYENDCEKIVRMLYPEVDKQLSWLLQYAPSRLTGTGSCIFAEFSTKDEAEDVLAKLPDTVLAFIAQGRNVSPLKKTLADYQLAFTHSN